MRYICDKLEGHLSGVGVIGAGVRYGPIVKTKEVIEGKQELTLSACFEKLIVIARMFIHVVNMSIQHFEPKKEVSSLRQ